MTNSTFMKMILIMGCALVVGISLIEADLDRISVLGNDSLVSAAVGEEVSTSQVDRSSSRESSVNYDLYPRNDSRVIGVFEPRPSEHSTLGWWATLLYDDSSVGDSDNVMSLPVSSGTSPASWLTAASTESGTDQYATPLSVVKRSPATQVKGQKPEVLIGVLLPFGGHRPFVIRRVAPAIEKAVQTVDIMGPWNFLRLKVEYADSQCDIGIAMKHAIHFKERLHTTAFFGPVCDYAIAPVARQAKYWNTPLITPGATAIDYYWYKSTTFTTLTRVGPANLQGCVEFIERLTKRHEWKKLKILYDSKGQDEYLYGFCHLVVEYLHYHLIGTKSPIVQDQYKLDRGAGGNYDHVLRTEVSTDFAELELRDQLVSQPE